MRATRDRDQDEAPHARHLGSLTHFAAITLVWSCTSEVPPLEPVIDPDDVDGDGVPNERDLCPHDANPDQHDEDGDGVGDACDQCPARFDPAQTDGSERVAMQFEDGVGDACDPRPTFSGDQLAGFFPFVGDQALLGWRGGGWSAGDDAVIATASADALWNSNASELGDGLFAELVAPIVSWQATDAMLAIGVDGDDGSLGYRCAIVRDRDGDGNDELEATLFGMTRTISLATAITGDVTLTAWRVIDRTRASQFFCRARIAKGTTRSIVFDNDDTATGHYGLAAHGVDATVANVVVYTFPVNPCVFFAVTPECNPNP